MAETALRRWARRIPGVAWTEAARGGTVGKPDCEVPLPDGRRVPVELKEWVWLSRKRCWRVRLRPAQVRWCCRETLEGRLTLVLWQCQQDPRQRRLAAAGWLPWAVEGHLPPEQCMVVLEEPEDFPASLMHAFPPGAVPNLHGGEGAGF